MANEPQERASAKILEPTNAAEIRDSCGSIGAQDADAPQAVSTAARPTVTLLFISEVRRDGCTQCRSSLDENTVRQGGKVFRSKCGATVAVPYWVKESVNLWTTAPGITEGPLLPPISTSNKVRETALGDWSVWSVVGRCAKEIGIKNFGLTSFAALAQNSAASQVATSSRSVPAGALFDPNHGALSRIRTVDRRRRQYPDHRARCERQADFIAAVT
jgi:hypothetical protein